MKSRNKKYFTFQELIIRRVILEAISVTAENLDASRNIVIVFGRERYVGMIAFVRIVRILRNLRSVMNPK